MLVAGRDIRAYRWHPKGDLFGVVFEDHSYKLQQVSSDAEAIELMNDCEYGLTASIWTKSLDDFNTLKDQVQAGTIFLNR